MKTADLKTMYLRDQLNRRGVAVDFTQAETLRRAQLALHRWAELECGDGNDFASWSIERDETTDKPYLVTHPHTGKSHRRPIPDRERGALARVLTICAAVEAHYYHQTDPRGCALYVSAEVLTDQNYSSRGVACCV